MQVTHTATPHTRLRKYEDFLCVFVLIRRCRTQTRDYTRIGSRVCHTRVASTLPMKPGHQDHHLQTRIPPREPHYGRLALKDVS